MSTDGPFSEVLKGNICLSGGAVGADAQWGMNAGRDGQSVIHWSFENHDHSVAEQEIVRLTEEQLEVADPFLKKAAKGLGKVFRDTTKHKTKSLLRRNYYQVAWAESVYVVASFTSKGKVEGGTGWAVEMYLNRMEKVAQFDPLPLYVFDQNSNKWFQWKAEWKEIDTPPKPSGVWAGIGTRKLSHKGKWAIRNLFGWYEENTPK